MDFTTVRNELLNEEYYEINHDSGLKIFVMEKPDYSGAYAIFGTKYGSVDTCYITEDGEMIFSNQGQISNKADAERFVEENKVRFSLAFGPILVDNGEVPADVGRTYPIGEGNHRYSRAGLGQLGELHYLMVTANLVTGYDAGTPTITMFAKRMQSFGCEKAYSLDGGQTAVIVTNNQLINRPDYGYQRQISDIIYFATALPEED